MKKLECIIRHNKLEELKTALHDLGIEGMTILEARGVGRQGGHTEFYRGAEYKVDFVPKVKVEIVILDELLNQAIDAITKATKTGKFGDGKIFVYPVEDAVRIRTGERGANAI